MINDYCEFCDYINLIYEKLIDTKDKKSKLTEKNYIARMLTIFTRRFTYPFLDKDDPTSFKNDFYDLNRPNYDNAVAKFQKRLRYSTSAIKYLYTGKYDGEMSSEDKFFKYLKNDLKDVEHGIDIINLYKEGKKGFDEEKLKGSKIYVANRNAVIEGPLRKRIGIKYTVNEFKNMYELALESEGKIEKKNKECNVATMTIMLMSYYYFYKTKRNCIYVPFIEEQLKTWYGVSGHIWMGVRSDKHSLGFKGTGLLDFEVKASKVENGVYARGNEKTSLIGPEIIQLEEGKTSTYLTDDHQYVIFVDEGQNTFSNLQKKVPKTPTLLRKIYNTILKDEEEQ